MSLQSNRFITFEGCVNFRDLGGYRTNEGRTVRWDRLYRSDALHELTGGDVSRALRRLGLQTMIDLRNHDEVRRDGTGLLKSSGLGYHHFPLLEERGSPPPIAGADVAERLSVTYQWIVHNSGALIADAVTTIADKRGQPAVFHCSAGKDRTGIIAALVLGALGVNQETVMADYLLTNEVITGIHRRVMSMDPRSGLTADTLRAQPVAMEQFLATLDSVHGGPEPYLRRHGVTAESIGRLKSALLD